MNLVGTPGGKYRLGEIVQIEEGAFVGDWAPSTTYRLCRIEGATINKLLVRDLSRPSVRKLVWPFAAKPVTEVEETAMREATWVD